MSAKLIREGLPIIVTPDEYAQLKAARKLYGDRWALIEQFGQYVLARVRFAGERYTESTSPPPEVYETPDGIAEPLIDRPAPPRPVGTDVAEALLSVREAEKYLDERMLNWRTIPATPPSTLVAGKLCYSEADLDGWIAHWRNAFVTVDDLTFDENCRPLEFL